MTSIARVPTILGIAFVLFGAAAAGAAITTRVEAVGLSTRPHALNSDLVVVPNDGTSWLEPAESKVQFLIRGSAETTASRYQLKSAWGSLGFEGHAGGALTHWPESQAIELWAGTTEKLHEQDFWYEFEVSPRRALNACRNLYAELSNQGIPRAQILGKDHFIRESYWLAFAVLTFDYQQFNPSAVGSPQPQPNGSLLHEGHWVWQRVDEAVRVKCSKFADGDVEELQRDEDEGPTRPSGPGSLRLPFEVQRIEIGLAPKETAAVCPVKINVRVDVYATATGTARVRLYDGASASPVLQVTTKQHHTGIFVGTGYFDAEVGQSGAGGLRAPDAPGPKGPTFGVATDSNVHTGVYRVEASNGVKSNHEGYKVTCTPPPFEPGLRGLEPAGRPTPPPSGPDSLGAGDGKKKKKKGKNGGSSGGPKGPSDMKAP